MAATAQRALTFADTELKLGLIVAESHSLHKLQAPTHQQDLKTLLKTVHDVNYEI